MEFKFSDLFFQKLTSVRGSGWLLPFKAFSGSFLSSALICFVQCVRAVSRIAALSFEDYDLSPPVWSIGGRGSMVRPFTWPMVT